MKQIYSIVIAIITLSVASACSHRNSETGDPGERISARGENIMNRGEKWSEGQRDFQKGQRMIERSDNRVADAEKSLNRAQAAMVKAQRMAEDSRADRVKGEQLVASGTDRMRTAEADYAAIRNGPSAVAPN